MAECDSNSSTNHGEEIAVGFRVSIISRRSRLDPPAVKVHVPAFAFDTEHDPVPLIVVTDLAASNHSRLVVAPRFGPVEAVRNTKVPLVILVFTVTPLAADIETDIEAGPIAFR